MQEQSQERYIHRHDHAAIFMHWFNTVCWLVLFITGMGLIFDPQVNYLGMWLPDLLAGIFGSGKVVAQVHMYTGVGWALVFFVFFLTRYRMYVDFVHEVLKINPARDFAWMVRKNIQMILGKKGLKKLGMSTEIPPQPFYNVGQKLFAHQTLVSGALLFMTGLYMFLAVEVLANPNPEVWAWARAIHFLIAGLFLAGLLVHFYMAAISSEEKPAFKSMFTGYVPEDYARHHHELWYEEVKKKKKED